MGSASRTGLVVAGAGARGAYEAGALSVLIPRMVDDDAAPRILVGTSAGALNVVGLAGFAGDGIDKAADRLSAMWSSVTLRQVVNLLPSVTSNAARYVGQLLGFDSPLLSLLDSTPQWETLEELLPLAELHDLVQDGPIDAVALATTSATTGGTVIFVEKKSSVPLPPYDAKRNITYVETTLTVAHVIASAAVPVAFRPVEIKAPAEVAGWYVDGGLRLNVPLKPAIDMGCHRLGVVATHPLTWPRSAQPAVMGPPDVFRSGALALQAMLVDRMVEDLGTLSKVNRLVAATRGTSTYEEVQFLFAGPPSDQPDAIGALANQVFADGYRGLDAARHPTAWLLNRLIGGAPDSHGELLSFFLFEPPFTELAAALGAEHAALMLTKPSPLRAPPWATTV